MLSLRQRQIEEVLDEDKGIYRQVFDREKEQAKIFNETVAPKSEIDLETEVKTEQSIEALKKLLEEKVNAVETLLGTPTTTLREKSLENLLKITDVVKIYNDTIRGIINPAVKNATRDITKVKIQEIVPQINTLIYGIQNIMLSLIEVPPIRVGGDPDPILSWYISNIPRLVVSLAVYRLIQKQLFINSFRPIEQQDINAEYNKISKEYEVEAPGNLPVINSIQALNAFRNNIMGQKILIRYALQQKNNRQPGIDDLANLRLRAIREEGREEGIQFTQADRARIEEEIINNPTVMRRLRELARTEIRRRGQIVNPARMTNIMNQVIIPAEIDGRLEELARQRLDSAVLRATEPIAPIDPALQAELSSRARAERTQIERVARMPVLPPTPELPPISRIAEREESGIREFQERRIDTFDTYAQQLRDFFAVGNPVANNEKDRIVDELTDYLFEADNALFDLENPAPRTPQEVQQLIMSINNRYRIRLINNQRNNQRLQSAFLRAINGILSDIRGKLVRTYRIEADRALEEARTRLSEGVETTAPTGFGKSRFTNRLSVLLPYDDSKNDLYDY